MNWDTIKPRVATPRQQGYLQRMFDDLMINREQRNAMISLRVHRAIKALDEISIKEASQLIEELIDMKHQKENKHD